MKTKGSVTYKSKDRFGTFSKECPTLKGIINNIGSKKMLPSSEVEKMVDHFHNWAVSALSCEKTPAVKIPNFGTFFLSPAKLRVRIINAIKYYRRGSYSYEKVCSIINRYYPIYKRAHFESLMRGRGITRKSYDGKPRKSLGAILGRRLRKDWAKY